MRFLTKIFVLVSIISFQDYSFSQEKSNLDSLYKQLSKTETDTARIKLFINISNSLLREDSIKKLNYIDSAIILSKKTDLTYFKAIAKKTKGEFFFLYKDYKTAIKYFELAYSLFKESNNISEQAKINYKLGSINYKLNNFEESLKFHKKSLTENELIDDTSEIVKSNLAVAVMCWRMGNLSNAELYYSSALDFANIINDKASISSALNSLGAIFWGLGDFNKAFEYFEKALKITKALKNDRKYILIINNIGLIYQEWGNNKEALDNYTEGRNLALEIDYYYGLAYSYSNIGKIYLLENENKKALLNFDSALLNYIKIDKKIGIAYSYRNMGDAYLGLNDIKNSIKYYIFSVKTASEIDSKQHLAKALTSLANAYFENNKYHLAKEYANRSLKISVKQDYRDISKDNYLLLSKIFEVFGENSHALLYFKKANSLKDSIFNEKNSKNIAEMQARYETEKKEQENITLKKEEQLKNIKLKANEVEIQNQNIIILAFAVLLILFILFAFIQNRTKNKLLKSKRILTKQNKEINSQREELLLQGENLKEINLLLKSKTFDLEDNKRELQKIVDKLKKATIFKDKVFSIIGHDLRGPVGNISSIVSLAMDERLSEEKRNKMLLLTKESAVATYTLLENLLAWATNEQGKTNLDFKNLNLRDIVLANIGLLNETARKKGILLNTDIPDKINIIADYNTLDTIFRNLISNAIKFTDKDGFVSVLCKIIKDYVEISIKDNGIGMTKSEIEKVLDTEQFFSDIGTSGEKGSGLGLQLCFEFIKLNKGNYKIISEKGVGSNFIFILPLAK